MRYRTSKYAISIVEFSRIQRVLEGGHLLGEPLQNDLFHVCLVDARIFE